MHLDWTTHSRLGANAAAACHGRFRVVARVAAAFASMASATMLACFNPCENVDRYRWGRGLARGWGSSRTPRLAATMDCADHLKAMMNQVLCDPVAVALRLSESQRLRCDVRCAAALGSSSGAGLYIGFTGLVVIGYLWGLVAHREAAQSPTTAFFFCTQLGGIHAKPCLSSDVAVQ